MVGAGHLNHRAPIHHHKVNSKEWTRVEFCLLLSSPPPPLPTKSGLPPLPLLPPHWFSTKRSHDSPFHSQRSPYLQQIHTQALAENHTHLQQSPHILLPPRSNILNLVCPGHSRGSKKQNKFLAPLWDQTEVLAVGARRSIHHTTSSDVELNYTLDLLPSPQSSTAASSFHKVDRANAFD